MAPRGRSKGKSDPADEADKAAEVVVLTSSDDEEANKDLSLAILEKAKQSNAKRKSVDDPIVTISSDDAELDKNGGDKVDGEGSRKKKRAKKKKKKEGIVVENGIFHVGVTDEEPPGTIEPVLTEGNEAPDNKVLRRLLRGARYFDPGETSVGMCFNCGEEGHMAANCTAERKKKPCFRCGQFGHVGKDCTQGQYCYACKKNGHKAKDCPEKNKREDSKVCLKCCGLGHDMFSCGNNYPPEDMKEIQCYVCKREGHLCCTVAPDSSSNVVSCYNCAELGHTGTGCAKPRRENGTVVPPILCYKCGEEGHFARGCRITNKSIVRSVLGITPKSNKYKMKEREKKFGFRSAPEEKKGMKRKGHHDKRGSFSTTPKSRGKGGISDFRSDIPSSSSPNKYKPKSWSPKERSYRNYGHQRDYSTPYSSEKRHWQGYGSPKLNSHRDQYKPRYTESRYSNSQTRFAQS
ncbi:hypothetical protein LUZ61_001178 [Rhynchospora tenuis]|uniref:CCHC-type domain-containing protein n=1 Tax=Rhynchospora tenuis TaxID=198213 RepID=A0AAD5ZGI7_9POAL|nr:hypothetical protein LUZ61_001178 [Rhynchospora tenuis]